MGAHRARRFRYPADMHSPARTARTILGFAALAACVAVCAGCASTDAERGPATSPAVDPIASAPSDLWLEIRTSPGRGVVDRPKVEERATRFVLLPDGSLHGETDRVPETGARPARLRRLSRDQMGDVWSLLVSAGFAEPALADTRGDPSLIEAGAGEVLATLEVHAEGERYAFVRRYTAGGEQEKALRGVIRAVASLGWASDEAFAEFAELPLRYDLGADPYARFARPAADAGDAGTPR
jgi:hypothetical protein